MSIKTQHIKSVLKIDGIVPEETSLWFRASSQARTFHCPTCGKFQFNHQHRILAMVDGDLNQVLMQPPLSIQCQKCGHLFHIHIY